MVTGLTQTGLRVHLFGQPRFFIGDAPYKFRRPPKVLSLFAYLLLHRGHPLAREAIAFGFWPDDTEEAAFANLRRHLSLLKNALPPANGRPWILSGDTTLEWNEDSEAWLDVAEFERLAEDERTRAEAVELCAGDLLEHCYDDWVLPFRERLRTKYLQTLSALVREQRSRRDFGAAISYLQRMLAADPWREDVVRQLMSVRYEMGDRAGALRLYSDFVVRLEDEMGTDPMPETVAVRDLILRNDRTSGEDAPHSEESTALSTRRLDELPFVGRAREIDQLRAIWMRAARGFGTTVFLVGEVGIGKTRLADELRLVAESEGARVLGGATSFPEAFPYQCVAEALRSAQAMIKALDIPAPDRRALARIVPILEADDEQSAQAVIDPERAQKRFLSALESLIVRLARSRPLLVILEDIHWAGEASLAALGAISRRIAASPVLIVATYRTEEVTSPHPLLDRRKTLTEEQRATAIALGPLSPEDVQQLAERAPGIEVLTDEVLSRLYEESEGNPLLVFHLIRSLGESPESLAESTDGLTGEQAKIRATIGARIEHLPEAARTLAEIACVGGRRFDVDTVRDVSGWNEAELLDAFDLLVDRHFIKEMSQGSRLVYGFTHHLVRSALYENLPPEIRTRRHLRFGRVMARAIDVKSNELAGAVARHYDLGGEAEEASRWYLAAAERALSLHALDEAFGYLNRGIELAAGRQVLAQLWMALETVHARRGERDAQRADLDELSRVTAGAADDDLACETLCRRIRLAHALGLRDEEAALIEDLRKRARACASEKYLARAGFAAASRDALVDRLDDAKITALSALAAFERLACVPEQIECLCLLAHLAIHLGALHDVEPLIERARALAEKTANPGLVAYIFSAAGGAAMMAQQFEACFELCTKSADLYRSIGDREGEATSIVRGAIALTRLERFEEAMAANESAARTFVDIGKPQGIATAQVNAAMMHARLGDFDGATGLLESARAHFTGMHDARGEAVCDTNIAFVRLFSGDAPAAKSIAQRAVAKAQSIGIKSTEAEALAVLGASERDLGETDAAIAHMESGLTINRMLSRRVDIANDLADLALAYLQKGDTVAARDAAQEMLEISNESVGGIFWPQYLYWAAANAIGAAGDRVRALALLEKAADYYRSARDSIKEPAIRERFARAKLHRDIEQALTKRGTDLWK
jgi:DNA-binding SARP family transcriptional activator